MLTERQPFVQSCQYQCTYNFFLKLYKTVLKILRGNQIMTDGRSNRLLDNPNPIKPIFQSEAIKMLLNQKLFFHHSTSTGTF